MRVWVFPRRLLRRPTRPKRAPGPALIDNHCGAKQKDEAAALKHPASCSLKESCSASGYQLVVGDKHYKLDDKGNEQAKAYIEKLEKKDAGAKVTVAGKVEGEKIEVSSIKEAEGK